MFKSILKWGLIVTSSGLVRDHPLGAPASVKVVYYALWWPPCQWNIPDEIMCKRITPPSWTNWSPFRIDLIKCIFSTKGFISLMFVSKGQIDNKWALVQVMAWRRTGAKPLSEAMLIKFTYVYMRTRGRLVKRTHQATIYKKNKHTCVHVSWNICHCHDDVIKWKHVPRYWPFVRGIHRSPVNYPHKGQWHGALMFSLICARINGWVNNGGAGDLRRHRAHYDVTEMVQLDLYMCCVSQWNDIIVLLYSGC